MALRRWFKDAGSAMRSSVCREADFSAPWYGRWVRRIAAGAPDLAAEQQAVWGAVWAGMRGRWLHRKLWEWAAIAQALDERGALAPGRSGVGFAVGTEPLASLFAARGASVLASDYAPGAGSWAATGQLAGALDAVHWPGLVSRDAFQRRVGFRSIDMRDLADMPREHFDFAWSSCSFEHLGSLGAGAEFVRNAMALIKPGGLAVHTTEINVSSDAGTIEAGDSVIYRRRDIEELDRSLRPHACGIEALDFDPGTGPHDLAFDVPPYYRSGRQHVKIALGGYVSTSILLIVRKG